MNRLKINIEKMTKIGIVLAIVYSTLTGTHAQTFKNEQLKYPRVRQAYTKNWPQLSKLLGKANITNEQFKLFVRAYKLDHKLELWVSNSFEENYKLLKTYEIVASSGQLGPKRKQGDLQVPEGVYKIDRFNPNSSYHLSLGLNYPNKADILNGDKQPGGDIFIHGSDVTIGCLPLTDSKIEEVYSLALMAKNSGQKYIYVHIYPFDYQQHNLSNYQNSPNYSFWKSLEPIHAYFGKHKKVPTVHINKQGHYQLN
jgi:murein L,D-transpeptidase YafK